jgi:hypothetical protein
MHAEALRLWGIVIGAALIAGAVALAISAGDPAPPRSDGPLTAGPLAPRTETEPSGGELQLTMSPAPNPQAQPAPEAEPEVTPDSEPVFEAAVAMPVLRQDQPSFIVRFAGAHALVAAQDLAAQGRYDDARRNVEQGLRRTRALRGLCFDRFTAGGAEIVLRPCNAVAPGARDQVRRDWERRFESMDGVAYADVNAIASREQR